MKACEVIGIGFCLFLLFCSFLAIGQAKDVTPMVPITTHNQPGKVDLQNADWDAATTLNKMNPELTAYVPWFMPDFGRRWSEIPYIEILESYQPTDTQRRFADSNPALTPSV